MKLKVSDIQRMAREARLKHEAALRSAVQNDGGVTSTQDYDVGLS